MINKSLRLCFPGIVILTSFMLAVAGPSYVIARQDHDEAPIELSGFSISEAYDISDDKPLDLDSAILKQLIYRIKNTSPKSRLQYSRYSQDLTWQDITTKTEDYRLWLFNRPARLKRIEKHRLKNLSPGEEVKSVFICHCESEPDNGESEEGRRGQTFLTIARTMPRALPVDEAIDEPIRVSGFLYSRISGMQAGDNNEMPVFITDRVAWFPSQKSENVSAAHVRLARLGVDIGLMDLVKQNNALPLGNRDAEAFFQFLAAVSRVNDNDNGQTSGSDDSDPAKLGFNEIMNNANAHIGQAVRVTGTVRSCSVISVPHADVENRLGLSQYYQLMLFPDLDGAKVIVKNKDGTKLDYRRFPITICCAELPEGLKPTDVEKKQFSVDGYFFRFWKYQSEKTDQASVAGQVSPLIIAKSPQLIEPDTRGLNLVLLIFVFSILAGIVALVGGFKIVDRKRQTPVERILDTLPEKIDLSNLED